VLEALTGLLLIVLGGFILQKQQEARDLDLPDPGGITTAITLMLIGGIAILDGLGIFTVF
jgi:hypothetical protein